MEIDYEKAYKEALERAKRLRDSKYQTMNAKRVVEEIFPQLAESEDERTRKGLVKLLTDASKTFLIETTGIEKASYLAYLERQKELFESGRGLYYYDGEKTTYCGYPATEENPYDFAISQQEKQKESLHISETCKEKADSFTSKQKEQEPTEELVYRMNGLMQEYVKAGKDEEEQDHRLKCYQLFWDALGDSEFFKQKEQKPLITGNDFGWIDELKHDLEHPEGLDQKVDKVLKQRKGIRALEWSEEDERLCNLIAKCIALGRKQGLVNDDDNIACLDLLMRKGTSWSRGDEKMLKLIISELEQEGKDVNAPELYKIEIDWLKSLRPPQYCEDCKLKRSVENWKPSEEQIYSLGTVVKGAGENNVGSVGYNLKELYEQLKKLGVKEEPEYYQHFDQDC